MRDALAVNSELLARHDGRVDVADWIASRAGPDPHDPEALGWAWATVDLERSQRDSGVPLDQWDPVVEDRLGARGLRLRGSEPSIVMLEPSTEGRLAGWLARHGEGEAAVYRVGGGEGTPGKSTPGDRRLTLVVGGERR
jgi:hypothetical protein